mmetsp:Transcript_63539/g.113403  ORF Transcript_63539/g.113403 Transcript_63539/m.113403 type:complete len:88 (-) Transcript_63539:41-304(-)
MRASSRVGPCGCWTPLLRPSATWEGVGGKGMFVHTRNTSIPLGGAVNRTQMKNPENYSLLEMGTLRSSMSTAPLREREVLGGVRMGR